MKTAVIITNLGGPDSLQTVRPFLRNLFADRSIIDLPALFRLPLAWLISTTRAPDVRPTYEAMGGRSPILPNTEKQAGALQDALATQGEYKVFIHMRYWHPMARQVAQDVKAYGPERIIYLPLYPQFSTTTTASSWRVWQQAARRCGLDKVPSRLIEDYPTLPGFIKAQTDLLRPVYEKALAGAPKGKPPRVLFTAHGLPQRTVDKRQDPYPQQVAQTAQAIVEALNIADLDWRVSYQSRVGPLPWIKPYTDAEIEQAGQEGRPLVLVPHSFVSEHLETLEELDIEYRELARQAGVPAYHRVPTVSTHPDFIEGLKELVLGGDAAMP